MINGSICQKLAEQLPLLFVCEERGEYVRIRTPYLYPDGDIIDLFCKICYRTENPFVSCRVAHRFAGKRKLTGTRLPSRWA
jgi:hypothetical protein